MMEFRVLGPLDVESDEGLIRITGAKERALLALLLFRANRLVSRDLLIDELWGEHPPATAKHTLEVYVSRLRRTLAADGGLRLIESRPGGYRIRIEDEQLDVLRFERLLEEGRAALECGAPDEAEKRLTAALALWRGPVLDDLAYVPFAEAEGRRLEELRLAASEAHLEAGLQLGRSGELVGELQSLVALHPLRERLRAQLMLALYRSGRQADALAVYRDGRRRLVDELGIEPSRELQELEQAILRHDRALELPTPSAEAPVAAAVGGIAVARAAVAQQRKIVTALSCGVVGTATPGARLDPEMLNALLPSFFERTKAIAEFHGGTVEKVVGDDVMAVFGVPELHEDDALRACRAALEMQQMLPQLGLRVSIGINSGEVLTGTAERLAIGNAVNVAARLQQSADAGEVLIGRATFELARTTVQVEPVEPLTLKDRTEPMSVYRLVSATRVKAPGRLEPHFVGREPELETVRRGWERARAERRCELVTIVGEAGIGKSRLVAEALATLNVHAVQARCPPYGEGITYWPVVEVVEQLGSLPSDPAAAAAIRALLRESDAGTSAEEIAWAFRKLLEQEAPLVVVFDDIHWGEETFLDLLEHLALMSAGMPILVLCMARPELLGKRAEWPVAMRLEPLAAEQVAELIGGRVPEELRERVARVAGGNPLFVVEMLAMAQEGRDLDVPPTLRALLAARLDQLDEPERRVLEHAAVEGEVFHRGAVRALTPDEPQVTHRLAALVRRGLIRRDKARITGEDSFRFCHLLIRDAAYDALPKSIRADLHERFADWLEQRGQALVELDELLGYHLERAVGLLRELGPPDEHARSVAREASERLARCGERARLRGDMYAAENLLVRSTSLLSRDNPARLRQALSLVEVLEEKSRTAEERELLHETLNLARAMGDNKLECRARLLEIYSCAERDPGFDCAAGLREAERLVKELERANERAGLARAWDVVGRLRDIVGRTGAAEDAYSRGCGYARSEGDRFFESWILIDWLFAKVEGPAPISDGVAFSESILERADTMPRVGSYARSFLALLYAQHGRFAEARQLFAQARHLAHQFGHEALLIFQPLNEAYVDLLAADASGAEEKARATIDLLRRADYPEHGAFLRLAQALYEQARFPEARQALELAGEIRSPDAQSFAAKLHAAEGDFAEAERLARRAVAAAAQTDHLLDHADTLLDLAEVLRLVRRPGEAVPHVQQAIRLFEQKEATYRAIKARAVLTNLAA